MFLKKEAKKDTLISSQNKLFFIITCKYPIINHLRVIK